MKLKFGDRYVDEIIEILGFLFERTRNSHYKRRRQKYLGYVDKRRTSGPGFALRLRIRFDVEVKGEELAAEVYLKFF